MAEGKEEPDDRKTRREAIDKFGDALERLITLARFMLSASEQEATTGKRKFPILDAPVYALIRLAFIQAEYAAHAARFGWIPPEMSVSDRHGPINWVKYVDDNLKYRNKDVFWIGAAQAGHDLYRLTIGHILPRWRCSTGVLTDKSGATWIGNIYPEDFPRYEDLILPIELDRLRDALTLVRLPSPAFVPETQPVEPDAAFGSVKLYGPDRAPIVANKERPLLTIAQYDALRALIEACKVRVGNAKTRPSGSDILSKYVHTNKPSQSDIGKHLRNIKKLDDDWKAAIDLADIPGGGYFIN